MDSDSTYNFDAIFFIIAVLTVLIISLVGIYLLVSSVVIKVLASLFLLSMAIVTLLFFLSMVGRNIRVMWKWYDLWIGVYIDRTCHTIYICPFPTVVIAIIKSGKGYRKICPSYHQLKICPSCHQLTLLDDQKKGEDHE